MSSKLIAEVRAVSPTLAHQLRAALGSDSIEQHVSNRVGLPQLKATLQRQLHAAFLDFITQGMKTLGQETHELEYGDKHPGMERDKTIRQLTGELKRILKETPLPNDPEFWT